MERVSGHTFFARFVDSHSVVVDLGANMGAFSRQMAHQFGCACYAIEPNPECFAHLNRFVQIDAFNLAIADRAGEMRFFVSANSEASSFTRTADTDREIVVTALRLDEFAQREGLTHIDLLKIDIEGAEIALLDSLPDVFLQDVGQIAIEFHDFCGLVSKDEVARVVRRMQALGFLSINFSRESHGHEDHLFVNTKHCNVGKLEFLGARYLSRNIAGALRMVRRWGARHEGTASAA